MKKIYAPLIIFVSLFSFSTLFSQEPFGVNLACAEFGEETMPGIYNQTYSYPNEAELDYFNAKGLKLIRLPFRGDH